MGLIFTETNNGKNVNNHQPVLCLLFWINKPCRSNIELHQQQSHQGCIKKCHKYTAGKLDDQKLEDFHTNAEFINPFYVCYCRINKTSRSNIELHQPHRLHIWWQDRRRWSWGCFEIHQKNVPWRTSEWSDCKENVEICGKGWMPLIRRRSTLSSFQHSTLQDFHTNAEFTNPFYVCYCRINKTCSSSI